MALSLLFALPLLKPFATADFTTPNICSPRTESSCEQIEVPHSAIPTHQLSMTGTGQRMTTSFDCKSFFADPGVQSSAANLCRVVVYEEPEVQGAVNAVSIKTKNSECISASGRSVRLDRTLQSDGSAAPRYVQSMCPNATSWDVSLKGALTMTSTISATGGPDAPSNRTTVIPATITAAEQPPKALLTFRGGILGDVYDQNPSFAALIALSAAFCML